MQVTASMARVESTSVGEPQTVLPDVVADGLQAVTGVL